MRRLLLRLVLIPMTAPVLMAMMLCGLLFMAGTPSFAKSDGPTLEEKAEEIARFFNCQWDDTFGGVGAYLQQAVSGRDRF